jgi:isoaspartyl peptidase/L-asparaginase-like protein (Ntn-hydrolase superfamily)
VPARSRRSAARWTLVIHGGAGAARATDHTPEREQAIRASLSAVLASGARLLESGGTSLDAVEQAVCALEDSPLFNAGRGSVLTSTGEHELEAAIMDGRNLGAGAVAVLRRIKNPVALARLVMERTQHVYLQGDGAEAFARAAGVARVSRRYFRTEERVRDLELVRARAEPPRSFGTVGAVALDRHGNLAASTSTGGTTGKLPGRVGDSSVIGAGTYASNAGCAVSCTGQGEFFIRAAAAHEICSLVEHARKDVRAAVAQVIERRLARIGGRGGAIAVDRRGRIGCAFNTDIMVRGAVAHDVAAHSAIGRPSAIRRRSSLRSRRTTSGVE